VAAALAAGLSATTAQGAPAAQCSRAAADRAILAAHKEGVPGGRPAGQVLCGAFTGPGVEAMAASVRAEGCGLSGDWLVWRSAGGRWQQVFESNNGVIDLAAVGSDIKETQNVLRPGDAHCFPTGGTRSQVWHWNGSRFVGSGWHSSKPQTPKPSGATFAAFFTPSHNLSCEMSNGGQNGPFAYCQSVDSPHSVSLEPSGTIRICRGPQCPGNADEGTRFRLLGYGSSLTVGPFRCTSGESGVTCVVTATGLGFRIDRDDVRRVGG